MFGRKPKHGLFAADDGSNHIDLKELRQLRSLSLVGRSEASGDAGVVDETGERPERFRRLLEQTMLLSQSATSAWPCACPPDFLISATVASAALASAV